MSLGKGQSIDIDDNVSLTRFRAEPKGEDQIEAEISLDRGILTSNADIEFHLLNNDEGLIGLGKFPVEKSDSADIRVVRGVVNIRLTDPEASTAHLCFAPEWKQPGRLNMSLLASQDIGVNPANAFELKVGNGRDWDEDTLEELAEKGSLPAALALFLLIAMLSKRRHVAIEHVAEILHVVGLFSVTLFILAHRIHWVAEKTDWFFLEPVANGFGSFICLMLVAVILILVWKGALFSGRDAAEIDLDIERQVSLARGGTQGREANRGRMFRRRKMARAWLVALVAVWPIIIGIFLLRERRIQNCSFVTARPLVDLSESK